MTTSSLFSDSPGAQEGEAARARAEAEAALYAQRMRDIATRERQTMLGLQGRARGDLRRQSQENTLLAQQDVGGAAGMLGPDPSRLRAGAYGQGRVGLQGANDLALAQSMQEQAFKQQALMQLGREGQYGTGAFGFGAQAYGQYAHDAATAAQQQAAEEAAAQAEEAYWAGVGTSSAAAATKAYGGSDRSLKEHVQSASAQDEDAALKAITEGLAKEEGKALRGLRGYEYDYKPDAQSPYETPPGPQYGPMANELKKTPVGRGMLTPDQRGIDYGGAVKGTMGLVGRLGERQQDVEARLKRLENYGPQQAGGADERMFHKVARERPQGAYHTGGSLEGSRSQLLPGGRFVGSGGTFSGRPPAGAELDLMGDEYIMPDGSYRRVPPAFPTEQGGMARAAEQIQGARQFQTVPQQYRPPPPDMAPPPTEEEKQMMLARMLAEGQY